MINFKKKKFMAYSGDGLGATHLGLHLRTHAGKRNPVYPIQSASFVSIVLYPILVGEKYH
jgi:hypothetical protein